MMTVRTYGEKHIDHLTTKKHAYAKKLTSSASPYPSSYFYLLTYLLTFSHGTIKGAVLALLTL